MRKAVGIFLVLLTSVLIYRHHRGGLGIRKAIRSSVSFQVVSQTSTKLVNWVDPDKTPPTAPQNLSGGPAPTILRVRSYLDRTFLTKHTTEPFDSTGGDLLVACASSHDGVMLSPSDTFGNSWISLAGPTNSSAGFNLRSQIWYAKNPTVGPNHQVTVTLSAGQALVISIFVVKGANVLDPIDAVSTIGDDRGAQTLTPTSPSIRTTSVNELLIGFGKSSFSEVWEGGEGFVFQKAASSDFLVAESALAAIPGDYHSDFVLSGPATWQAFVVAVKPPATHTKNVPVTLAWWPSSDNVGVAGYQVERCEGVSCLDFTPIGTSADTFFVDPNLASSAVYRYRVRAFDASYNLSEYSNTIVATNSTRGD